MKDQFSQESLLDALRSVDHLDVHSRNIETSGLKVDAVRWIESNFSMQRTAPDLGLITGYYLPRIKGSLTATDEYQIPVYALPPNNDLIGPTRHEIESCGALSGKNLEIAWVQDKVDLFFVHIQGYAILELPDQSTIMLQKTGSNQHSYFSIGKVLIEREKIAPKQMSMQSIRKYLNQFPEQIDELLQLNPRYIYFSLQKNGPIGSAGFPLVPLRSVATDWHYYPPHSLLYIETALPDTSEEPIRSLTPVSFIAIAHDTGSAITGVGRIDLYCGEDALLAGHLKSSANIYLLTPK